MSEVRAKVFEVVLEVVRENHPEIIVLRPGDRIVQDLGLRSLDLARIVAKLEVDLGRDPFVQHVALTSIRVLADLCDAYLSTSEAPASNADEDGRATKRLESPRLMRAATRVVDADDE
jgi:hypothetical protein